MPRRLSGLVLTTWILAALVSGAEAVTFGETGTGNTDLSTALNNLGGSSFVCPTSGNINRILLYVINPAGGQGLTAIYSATPDPDNNTPNALMAASNPQLLVAGWNTFIIPSTAVTAGQTYYLCNQVSNNSVIFRAYSPDTYNYRTRVRYPYLYGTFPDPFGTPTAGLALRFCIYATEILPTPTFTPTFTATPTSTVTPTLTSTLDVTPSFTPTATPTFTVTPSITFSHTATISLTATESATVTITPTPSFTRTVTPTRTITLTATDSPTATVTPTITQTSTITQTRTHTPVHSPTITSSITQTLTITQTSTITPTSTITQTLTISPTSTISSTRTHSATITPTYTVTLTPTPLITAPDLSQVVAYPNPWSGEFQGTRERIAFWNLSQNPTIRIYTLAGGLVTTLKPGAWADGGRTNNPGDNGRASWGLTNKNGRRVSSGVYIYIITDQDGREQRGKLAIKR